MSASIKYLDIPYIQELDGLDMDQATDYLYEKGARHIVDSLNWPEAYPYKPLTYFIAARGDKELFVQFIVRSNYLRAVNSADQTDVEQDSCVGLSLYNPSTKLIYDFAFNCIGTCKAVKGADKNNMQLIDQRLVAGIRRNTDLPFRPFVEMEGLFGWHVMVAIPLDLIDLKVSQLHPIKGNFYKRADATSLPHFLSWNPINTATPDLLDASGFADIRFD